MSRRTRIGVIVALIAVVAGGVIAFRINKKRNAGTEVRLEQVSRRDLVSSVTASGKIEAQTSVDISADITGRIIDIAVREGDLVKRGQFLLQIDPAQYQAAVARAQGVVSSTEATLVQTRATRDQAQRAWNRARQLTELGDNLIAPETAEQARTALDVAEANYQATRAQLEQARASLQESKDNLAKVQVDETDVVRLSPKDSVEVTIDAYRDTTFWGRVTKVSHSAKLTPTETASGSTDRAVDFDVEITLQNAPPDIRPDLSCTARIITDTRVRALSIPIIALTVREHEKVPNESEGGPQADTLRARFKKREAEGVFVVRNGVATFRPVKTGVAGDEYFEVTDGLREGETIVAGTYQAIRDLKDGAKVRAADTTKTAQAKS